MRTIYLAAWAGVLVLTFLVSNFSHTILRNHAILCVEAVHLAIQSAIVARARSKITEVRSLGAVPSTRIMSLTYTPTQPDLLFASPLEHRQ